tara:strand:- start:12955 stop:14109 length:1155 start_codon:yes stop_codon:yes gene_type:complete
MTYLKVFFKYIYYLITIVFLSNIDRIIYLIFNKKKKIKNKKILFIKNDNLGDFILWENSFLNFIKHYQNYEIYLICNSNLYRYLSNRFENKINLISLNRSKFLFNIFYRINFLRKLYECNFDIIINSLISRNLVLSDQIVKNFQKSEKIAFKDNQNQLSNFFSNLSNSYYDKLILKGNYDEVTNNQKFYEKITNKKMKFYLTLKKSSILKSKKKYVVISLGTSDIRRNIPNNKIIKISNYLLENTNLILVFTGIALDQSNFLYIKNNIIKKNNRIRNKLNKYKIDEFVECIRRAELVITAETATMHISNILKKKTLSVVGGGYFSRFVEIKNKLYFNKNERKVYSHMNCFNCSWNCKFEIRNGSYACIDKIETEEIIKNLKKLI